ncbi:TolC family protein [Sulfitobacter sp. SK012]|uniref:TolC family protein n=1 Tax=Sulfitobacter sp. SK012 TaxID=1389005 RepID=UPI0013B41F04|nr:TolC family protein [Sulfitobacter sp. SK012]
MKRLNEILFFFILGVVSISAASAETIKEAVQFALTTNPALKVTEAEMRASTFELIELRREYLPTVRVFGEAGLQRVNDPENLSRAANNRVDDRAEIGINASIVMFDGFRRANLVYADAARVDGNVFRLLDASEIMALNVAEAYIDVVRHRALIQVAKRNIASHQALGRRIRDLVAAGRLPYSDELTIDDRISFAELALLDVEKALGDASARYERIVGRKPDKNMRLQSGPVPKSLDILTQKSVANSYRIKFIQTEIDQSQFRAEVGLSDNMPTVTLDAGVSQDINRNGVSGRRTDQYVGVGLRWTLYQGGRKAERNAFAQRTQKALSERALAVREVVELAALTWNNYQSTAERNFMLGQQLQINRLIVNLYNEEFAAAKRTLLDLLEVQRARFNVEFQKTSSDAGVAFGTYRVLAAGSELAQYFGIKNSDIAFAPNFQERVKNAPTQIFNVNIEPMK